VGEWQQQQQLQDAYQQQQQVMALMQQQVQQGYGCGGAICGGLQCSVPGGGCAANLAR
jgi:hypothetical protein